MGWNPPFLWNAIVGPGNHAEQLRADVRAMVEKQKRERGTQGNGER